MKRKKDLSFFLVVLFLGLSGASDSALADHDKDRDRRGYQNHDDDEDRKHRRRNQERHRDNGHDGSYLKPVNHLTYREECGACHFPYQPELLPSASWMQILSQLEDHFGESIQLDEDSKKAISGYLKSSSAEYSSAKRAVKIMRSLGKQVPSRITEIPYIREKHHEISAQVFKRESIGSLSNCIACHTTAERGIYDDDNVRIPD